MNYMSWLMSIYNVVGFSWCAWPEFLRFSDFWRKERILRSFKRISLSRHVHKLTSNSFCEWNEIENNTRLRLNEYIFPVHAHRVCCLSDKLKRLFNGPLGTRNVHAIGFIYIAFIQFFSSFSASTAIKNDNNCVILLSGKANKDPNK